MNRKQFILIVLSFILLVAGRLWIAGTGYLEDQDEFLYIWMHQHFSEFANPSTWSRCMFDMQGQPPEIIIRLFQYISLLPVASITGKQMLHPDVLYFNGLYNVLVSLISLFVFFRILLKLNFTFELALSGMILLGTLFNFNIYTRHILPYEHAFLFQLLAINILLREELSLRAVLLAGLLSAIGLTNYLGCFMFVFINFGILVLRNWQSIKAAIKNCLWFSSPFFGVIFLYELFTRANGCSYLGFIGDYYETVNMASFDEGFVFLFLYFYHVEKWWGIVLLVLFFIGAWQLFKKDETSKVKQVLILGIVAYLSYGGYVYFFHRMVFHGRILHIYFPFIIIGVLGFLKHQKLLQANYLAFIAVIFATVNYGFVIADFNQIGYPRNAIYKYHLFEDNANVQFNYFEEIKTPIQYSQRGYFSIDSTGPALLPPGKYALRNICFMSHFPDSVFKSYSPWQKAPGDSIVFEELHFQSHPAYALEYCNRYGRNFFLDKNMKISVVKIHSL